jgi:hypothetical protein
MRTTEPKKTAVERRSGAKERLSALAERLNAQQLESVTDMLEKVFDDLPNANLGETITASITKRENNCLNIALENANHAKKTHFEKTVLGVCRKAHIESLIYDTQFDFKIIKQRMYGSIALKDQDDTLLAATQRENRIHDIYRQYYKKLLKAKKSYHNSNDLIELQEEFRSINVYKITEFLAVTLEGRQQKVSANFAQWAAFLIRIILEERR